MSKKSISSTMQPKGLENALDELGCVCSALVALTRPAAQHDPIPSLRSHWATETSAACSPSGSLGSASSGGPTGQASLWWCVRTRILQHRCRCCRCRYARPYTRPARCSSDRSPALATFMPRQLMPLNARPAQVSSTRRAWATVLFEEFTETFGIRSEDVYKLRVLRPTGARGGDRTDAHAPVSATARDGATARTRHACCTRAAADRALGHQHASRARAHTPFEALVSHAQALDDRLRV